MAFAVKYRSEWTDINGVDWRYDVEEDGYSGAIIPMFPTDAPLSIEYLTFSDDLLTDPIKGSTATLNIECRTNFQYIGLYSEADLTFKAKVYRGATPTLYWQGWVGNDYTEPYDATPYTVKITASDGLGLLKYIDFKDESGNEYTGRETEREIILNILAKIGCTEFDEYINLYEYRINSDVDDSPIDQIKAEQGVFRSEDCYTALVEILKHYNAIIRQIDSRIVIYRPKEMTGDIMYGRTITASSIVAKTFAPDQYLYRDGYNESGLRDVNGGVMMMKAPAAAVEGKQNYGRVDSWVDNWELKGETFENNDFRGWIRADANNYVVPVGNYVTTEKEGAAIIDSELSPAFNIYQDFGEMAVDSATDIIILEFEYGYFNNSAALVNDVDIAVSVQQGSYYLRVVDANEMEWTLTSSIITITENVPVGWTGWKTWKRQVVGLPVSDDIRVRLFTTEWPSTVYACYKNIKFIASSDQIARFRTTSLLREYSTRRFSPSTMTRGLGKTIVDIEEIMEETYEKVNSVNGERASVEYSLGDVRDTAIDNVASQFAGALSLFVVDELSTVASEFITSHASAYTAGGVIVTSDGNEIIFTSSVAGQDFTGATSITNASGDLSGSVEHTVGNSSSQAQIDTITITPSSGGSGTADIYCNGVIREITWAVNRALSISNFVSNHSAAYAAAGVTLTSTISTLIFTASVAGVPFINPTYIQNLSGTISGTIANTQANITGVARVDTITLTGTTGTANITCDGVTRLASITTVEAHTRTWSTRGNSEESNLMELLIDEIAEMKSKGRQFVQLSLMETEADTFFNMMGNLQDPINVSGENYRVFIPNRASYDTINRIWSVDLIEIGVKSPPA